MTQCKCGFSEGDRVITISWDGHSDDGCWVSSMRELVGQEGVITRISHDDYSNHHRPTRRPEACHTKTVIVYG